MAVLLTIHGQVSYDLERHVDTTGSPSLHVWWSNSKDPAQYYSFGSVWGSGELQ